MYEVIRLKLVRYFEARMCDDPDDLADVTIDRVARRLAEGEQIEAEMMRYVYGVARKVLLEYWKRERREESNAAKAVAPSPEDIEAGELIQMQLDCFAECLQQQPDSIRSLVMRYYEASGQEKIRQRAAIASEMGVPPNALRIRIHRIKADIQRCMDQCMKRVRG